MAAFRDHYLFAASIDIGTTHSGYAFSFKSDCNAISAPNTWISPTGKSCSRCPTSVLLNPDGSFHSFGYEAEADYLKLGSDTGHQLYRNFKMVLYDKDLHINSIIRSATGHLEKAIKVFAMVIQFLKDHLLDLINSKMNGTFNEEYVCWVLTVPNKQANDFMRKTAFEAGLIKKLDSQYLKIALESEASLTYWMFLENCIKTGDKVLLVDAGGSLDLTVIEALSEGQKEITKTSLRSWVDKGVEDNLISLLTTSLGTAVTDQIISSEWAYMIQQFKNSDNFEPDGKKTVQLKVPSSIKLKNVKNINRLWPTMDDKKMALQNGFLRIRYDVVVDLYKESCTKIVKHVQQLLNSLSVDNINSVILTGGYAKAIPVQTALKDTFGDKYEVRISSSAEFTVVMGAVLFGHIAMHKDRLLCSATYGCPVDLLFDEKIHDPTRRYKSKRDGQFRCRGTFLEFAKIGQKLWIPEEFEHTLHPLSKSESKVTIPILISKRSDILYCDEAKMYKVGELNLESPRGFLSDDIKLKVTFRHNEILVEARGTQREDGFPVETFATFPAKCKKWSPC